MVAAVASAGRSRMGSAMQLAMLKPPELVYVKCSRLVWHLAEPPSPTAVDSVSNVADSSTINSALNNDETSEVEVETGDIICAVAASSDHSLLAFAHTGSSSCRVVSSQPPGQHELQPLRVCQLPPANDTDIDNFGATEIVGLAFSADDQLLMVTEASPLYRVHCFHLATSAWMCCSTPRLHPIAQLKAHPIAQLKAHPTRPAAFITVSECEREMHFCEVLAGHHQKFLHETRIMKPAVVAGGLGEMPLKVLRFCFTTEGQLLALGPDSLLYLVNEEAGSLVVQIPCKGLTLPPVVDICVRGNEIVFSAENSIFTGDIEPDAVNIQAEVELTLSPGDKLVKFIDCPHENIVTACTALGRVVVVDIRQKSSFDIGVYFPSRISSFVSLDGERALVKAGNAAYLLNTTTLTSAGKLADNVHSVNCVGSLAIVSFIDGHVDFINTSLLPPATVWSTDRSSSGPIHTVYVHPARLYVLGLNVDATQITLFDLAARKAHHLDVSDAVSLSWASSSDLTFYALSTNGSTIEKISIDANGTMQKVQSFKSETIYTSIQVVESAGDKLVAADLAGNLHVIKLSGSDLCSEPIPVVTQTPSIIKRNGVVLSCADTGNVAIYSVNDKATLLAETNLKQTFSTGVRHVAIHQQRLYVVSMDGSLYRESLKNIVDFMGEISPNSNLITWMGTVGDDQSLGVNRNTDVETALPAELLALEAEFNAAYEKNKSLPVEYQLAEQDFFIDEAFVTNLELERRRANEKLRELHRMEMERDQQLYKQLYAEYVQPAQHSQRLVRSFYPHQMVDGIISVSDYPILAEPPERLLKEKLRLCKSISENVAKALDTRSADAMNYDKNRVTANSTFFNQAFTDDHCVNFIVACEDEIRSIKLAFNAKMDGILRQKKAVLQKIAENKEQMDKLVVNVEREEDKWIPSTADGDVLEIELLKTAVSITTAEVRREVVDEVDPQAQDMLDERRRALHSMMGDSLNKKAGSMTAVSVLDEPECMKKDPSDLTDEDRTIIAAYQAQVQAVRVEREQVRKQLESEYRKISSSLRESCEIFDNQLLDMFKQKVDADLAVRRYEFLMSAARHNQFVSLQMDKAETMLQEKVQLLKLEKQRWVEEIPLLKGALELKKGIHDAAIVADKDLERVSKREFGTLFLEHESLLRIFKAKVDGDEPLPAMIKPDQLDAAVWQQFLQCYKDKKASELAVKRAYSSFCEMEQIVTAVLDMSERIRQQSDACLELMRRVQDQRFRCHFDTLNIIVMPKTQIELAHDTVVTDFASCKMVPRKVIVELNSAIKNIAKTKMRVLNEIKSFRKSIRLVEWENMVADLEAEHTSALIKESQALRLTDEMQEFLRSGERHRVVSEAVLLERRLASTKRADEHEELKLTATIEAIQRDMAAKAAETQLSEQQLEELQQELADLDEKGKILISRRHQLRDHAPSAARLWKLQQNIRATDEQCVQLARELDTMRKKTYPILPAIGDRDRRII